MPGESEPVFWQEGMTYKELQNLSYLTSILLPVASCPEVVTLLKPVGQQAVLYSSHISWQLTWGK